MPIQGWKLATAVALAGAACTAAAAPAYAAAPVGPVLAEDARETPVVDDRDRLVFMTRSGTVRVLDPTAPADSRDLPVGCQPDPPLRAVEAAAQGFALVRCAGSRYGSTHVLDLATGALTAVAKPLATADWDVSYTGIGAAGVCFTAYSYKNAAWQGRVDWRTGEVARDASCAATVPAGPSRDRVTTTDPDGRTRVLAPRVAQSAERPFVAEADGVITWATRTVAPEMNVYAYLGACGVRLGWTTSPLTQAVPLPAALVLASSTRGSGPVTLRRVSLDGVCRRTTPRWRVSVASGRRRVSVPARSAAGGDAATGAATRLLRPAGPVPALRGVARRTTVTPAASARLVRWRVGNARWQRAVREAGRWTLRGLRPRTRGTLALDVRGGDGSRASYEVRLR